MSGKTSQEFELFSKHCTFSVCCREKLDDQLEKEARYHQLLVHTSHDSAIDTDSIEWETEVVELEKHRVRLASPYYYSDHTS